jgi:MFS family permease
LREAARQLLADEDSRGSSLNGRGTALAGFVGVILSIAAAGGAGLGSSTTAELGHGVRIAVAVLIAFGLLILVAAVIAVVWKVLLPSPGETIALADTDHWIDPTFTDRVSVNTEGYLLDGYTKALRTERERNDKKADWLGRSYIAVCIGLVLVAIAGAAATLDRYVGGKHTAKPAQAPAQRGGESFSGGAQHRKAR